MTYIQVQQLATDNLFQNRVISCMWNQALTYQTDADAPSAAMAQAILRGPTPASTEHGEHDRRIPRFG